MLTIQISYLTLLQVAAYLGVGVVTSLLAGAISPSLFVLIALLWPAFWILALLAAPAAWLVQRNWRRRRGGVWNLETGRYEYPR